MPTDIQFDRFVGLLMFLNMEQSMNKRVQIASKELRVVTVEAQELVWRLAPRDWIGKRKAAIAGVARRLGWDFARTWNIAHGRARVIRAEEWIKLNEELAVLKDSAARRLGALNELDLLERAAVEARRQDSRPMGVDRNRAEQARPGAKHPA